MTLNGKVDVGMLFGIIARRLDPPPLDRCACGAPAVETLWPLHRFVLPRGICRRHLEAWRAAQLLGPPGRPGAGAEAVVGAGD